MKWLKQIRGAPRWARITVLAVWALVLIAALGIGGELALDASYQKGFEAGAAAPASGPVAEPQLPSWLPAGTDREAAQQAMRDGLPFQVVSLDEGFGCAARLLLMPDGRLWWLGYMTPGGAPPGWEVGSRHTPRVGCWDKTR